jgi:hypothetical protein
MFNNVDINHLLVFSVKDAEARKHFLIGTLVYLLAFIIPILPLLVITGYMVRIVRQVLRGEKPHMEAWDNWQEMFLDGARLFVIRLVYMLPFFILFIPFFLGMFAFPFLIESGNENLEKIAIFFPLLFMAVFMLIMPLSIAVGLLIPVAEIHSVAENEIAAGFQIRAWWAIFRKNWGGFLLAFVISYAVSFVLMLITQFAMITIVLICALPVIMPAISLYIMLVTFTAFALVYKSGVEQLENDPVISILQDSSSPSES